MNYSSYLPGQLQQSGGDIHVPSTLQHGSQSAGMEMSIPSSFHHPPQLTHTMQGSLGPGLTYQASGPRQGGVDAFTIPASTSQVQVNPQSHAAMMHVGPPVDVLTYLTTQSQDPHQGQQQTSDEAGVGTIIRTVMQGPTTSLPLPQENSRFFRDDDRQASEVFEQQGNHELQPSLQPKEPRRVRKGRKPLSESRLNVTPVVQPSFENLALPGGFKYKFSDQSGKRTVAGILASRVIEMGERFGPYNGCLLEGEAGREIESAWEICVRGRVKYYVDGSDKIHKNWLLHIRPARTAKEQNMEAFQSYGDIYYRAIDTIQPGTELKVFYCKEYREKVGCSTTLDDMTFNRAAGNFECKDCRAKVTSSKTMMRHLKFQHTSKESMSGQRDGTRLGSEGVAAHVSGDAHTELRERRNTNLGDSQEETSVDTTDGQAPADTRNLRTSKATKKLYQYALHDGGKDDANLQRNISARKQKRELAKMKKASPKPAVTEAVKDSSSQQKEKKKDKERTKNKASTKDEDQTRDRESCRGEETRSVSECVCSTCGKVFSSKGKLAAHQLFHESTSEFRCKECDFVCKSSQTFQRHKNTHADRPFKCELCENQYGYTRNWVRHMQNRHSIHAVVKKGMCKYLCCYCRYSSDKVKPVERHLFNCLKRKSNRKQTVKKKMSARGRHSVEANRNENNSQEMVIKQEMDVEIIESSDSVGEDVAEASPDAQSAQDTGWLRVGSLIAESTSNTQEESPVGSSNNIDLACAIQKDVEAAQETSKMSRSASQYFECSYCSKKYTFQKSFQKHIRDVHQEEKYKCDFCPRVFRNKPGKIIHMRTHSKDRPYKCELCPRSFSSEAAFNNHRLEHKDTRPFKCEPCHRSFSTKKQYDNHQKRIHRKRENQFPCTLCNKKFRQKCDLRRHTERHLGVKRFSCEVCGRAFTAKDSVQKHMVIHTGARPFECKICGMKFGLNHHLDRHALTHLRDLGADDNSC